MAVRKNKALAKLRAGQTIFGPTVAYASPDLAERVAHLGFDYVWLAIGLAMDVFSWAGGGYTNRNRMPMSRA